MQGVAILTVLALLALPAIAQQAKAPTPPDAGAPGTNLDMPFLIAPLTNSDGKLIGYAYISSRLTASSDNFALRAREKLPFIQDAFVRDVNESSVATAKDIEQVDVAALQARLLGDARRVMGPGEVKVITVCTVQIAELHPLQPQSLAPSSDNAVVDNHNNPVKSRCGP